MLGGLQIGKKQTFYHKKRENLRNCHDGVVQMIEETYILWINNIETRCKNEEEQNRIINNIVLAEDDKLLMIKSEYTVNVDTKTFIFKHAIKSVVQEVRKVQK